MTIDTYGHLFPATDDALRKAGYPDEESAFLVGHTKLGGPPSDTADKAWFRRIDSV